MGYTDFNLKKVKTDLNLKLVEKNSVFSHIKSVEISNYLKDTLKRNVPLALAINTEKARSEMIIINILLEIKDKFSDTISLFSGIDFNIDKEKGLTGFCDFIISNSPEQLFLDSPILAIVEAKNENIISKLIPKLNFIISRLYRKTFSIFSIIQFFVLRIGSNSYLLFLPPIQTY
ncbi:MAG: hypothetical protein HQK77_20370 [Desulfobacterales bacterium]|nr:hypothetical protein [Desulfobacterales bacterium]